MSQEKEQGGKRPQKAASNGRGAQGASGRGARPGENVKDQGKPRGQKSTSAGGKTAQGGKDPKKPPKYTGKALIVYRSYIALTVISAVIVAGYILFNLFSAAPDPDGNKPGVDNTRPPIVITTTDPEGNQVEIEVPGLPADRKKEFYTFLLIGQSQETGGSLTDTMMLAAYDVPNQTLNVMNLPRDTYVRYRGDAVLLNSVFTRAGAGEKGLEALKKEVQELTGIYPDYHVIIQWEALGELVDAIGGVYFEVPFDMYYNDLSQHFKIDLKKGYQLLDGDKAMQLIRYRMNSIGDTGLPNYHYGYAEGDIGRIKTQQAFMKAIIAKCLQPEVLLPKLGSYINIFMEHVETNLSAGNMAYFGKSAIGGLEMDKVAFVTLPNKSAGNGHLLPVGSQLVSEINNGFNPYKENIRLGELDLVTAIVLPTESPDPEESEEPTADPEESGEPNASALPEPSETPTGEPILPPGVVVTARPGTVPSARPSAAPADTPRPGESQTAVPSAEPTDTPEPTPEPTPTSAEPAPEPGNSDNSDNSDNEPLLPPGV